jgi:membrane-associated phospholipid phosphatase
MKGLAMELAYTEETAQSALAPKARGMGTAILLGCGLSASLRLLTARWRRLGGKTVAHSGMPSSGWPLRPVMFFLLGDTRVARVGPAVWSRPSSGRASVAAGLKRLIRRPRPDGPPDGLYPIHDHYSLPSGHAVRVAAIATVLGPLIPGWLIAVLALWAAAVALSRVLLGVHYLLDVLSGIVLGGMVGLVLMLVG